MNQHPILFSGEMVKAIIGGHKTETRRKIKDVPSTYKFVGMADDMAVFDDTESPAVIEVKCPYGSAGHGLWVRESWRPYFDPKLYTCVEYKADGARWKPTEWTENEGFRIESGHGDVDAGLGGTESKWCPSIHLFRCASRIDLRVETVGVERVQDIDEASAKAEGATPYMSHMVVAGHGCLRNSHIAGFALLWNSINGGKRNSGPFCWSANPLVWVVKFTVLRVRTNEKYLTAPKV